MKSFINSSIRIMVVTFTLLAFTGCVKNKYEVDTDGNTTRLITEFADGREELVELNVDAAAAPITVDLATVQAVFRSKFSESYTVTIVQNPTLVADYNMQHGTSYTVPPASVVSLQSTTLTISPDSREVPIKALINTNALLQDNYAIGLSIAQVSKGEISQVAKNLIIALGVKNPWDGNYRIKGLLQGHPSLSGPINDFLYPCGTFSLVTAGPTSVDLYDAQPYGSGSSMGLFGVYPRFHIDPATNKVTVSDAGGNLSSVQNFTDYNSRYDPATKTFYIKWGWNGTRVVHDTLTYCGPR